MPTVVQTIQQMLKVSIYLFIDLPLENKALMQARLNALKREHFEPTVHTKLCSEHFTPDCFEYQTLWNSPQTRRKIKKEAIPSLFKFKPKKPTRVPTSYTFGASVSR